MRDTSKTLDWFTRNIERQLADIWLDSVSVSIETYFDTSHVRDAVLGMDAFYGATGEFNAAKFRSGATLVQSLFSGGWLGSVRLLPPHQAEFLNLLRLELAVPTEHEFEARIPRFLEDVGVAVASNGNVALVDLVNAPFHTLTEHPELATVLFKAVEAVQCRWPIRLSRWWNSRTLDLATPEMDYSRLMRQQEFAKIKAVLDKKRPNIPANNLADAAVIATLVSIVDDRREGTRSHFPVFYTTPLLHEAVVEAGLAERLAPSTLEMRGATGGDGDTDVPAEIRHTRLGVLCDASYFMFRAIVRPGDGAQQPSEDRVSGFSKEELYALYRDLRSLQDVRTGSALESSLKTMRFAGRPLDQALIQLEQFSFVDVVWAPLELRRRLKVAGLVGAAAEAMKGEEVLSSAQETVGKIKRELSTNAGRFRELRDIFLELHEKKIALNERLMRFGGLQSADPLLFFGLLRFSFPVRTHQAIRNVLSSWLTGDETTEWHAAARVVTASVGVQARTRFGLRDVVVACATLWTAQLYAEVERVALPFVNEHFSIQLVHAAAAVESRNADTGSLLAALERKLAGATEQVRAPLLVGLAYLYFHEGLRNDYIPSWRPSDALSGVTVQRTAGAAVRRAADLAREAATDFQHDPLLRAYAVNLALYYSLTLREADAVKLRPLALQLWAFRSNAKVWQYRYDDTLARYFYLLALHPDLEGRRDHNLAIAVQHIEAAWQGSAGDREVEDFRTLLAFAELQKTGSANEESSAGGPE